VRSKVRSLPALAVAGVIALGACEFSDSIDIGHQDVGGASGGGVSPSAGRGSGAAGRAGAHAGGGGTNGTISPGAGARHSMCAVGFQPEPMWVKPSESSVNLSPGVGGILMAGEYQLTALIKYGVCPCFDANATLAQALFLGHEGMGSVVSLFQEGGRQFTTKFSFVSHGNAFTLDATCSDPAGPPGAAAPFGSFETFTADGNVLSLISAACSYRADYRLIPRVPSR
jgi:hypothetical protein